MMSSICVTRDMREMKSHIGREQNIITVIILLAVEVVLVFGFFVVWGEAFHNGVATPTSFLRASAWSVPMLVTFIVVTYASWLGIIQTWKESVRGFVRWYVHFPSGKVRQVITPRGQRPKFNTRRVLAVGSPLGGWFHRGQVWDGWQRRPYRIKRHSNISLDNLVQIIHNNGDVVTTPINGPMVTLLARHPEDHWEDSIAEMFGELRHSLDESIDLAHRLNYAQDEKSRRQVEVFELSAKLSAWRGMADDLFRGLMSTDRLIFTIEGQMAARQIQQFLLRATPADDPLRQQYEEAQIPPTRRRPRKTTSAPTVSA